MDDQSDKPKTKPEELQKERDYLPTQMEMVAATSPVFPPPWGGDDFGTMPFAAEEGTQALAGMPLAPQATIADSADIIAALRTVHDPEIPVNIYDLGLIYRSDIDSRGDCAITMTLTAPACPVAGEMPQQVADCVAAVDGIGVVTVILTWTPPWRPDMMSEDARLALDFF